MANTSSNLPVCVFCGTPRPADETLCPKCGKPWIDVNVSGAEDGAAAAAAAAAAAGDHEPIVPPPPAGIDDTGEFDFDSWTLPPEPTRNRLRWLIPIVLLIGVVVLWSFVFVNRDSSSPPSTVAALETTTTLQTTTTTTQPSSSTTANADTTTTTTTAPVYPPADSWDSFGNPIPIAELGLRASGIGPIVFGAPIAEAAGALVASLGSAEMSGFDSKLCASQDWYWITWGDLRAIFDGYDENATFIGYRYETTGDQPSDPILETLSGIRLGDTVAALQSTYGSYTVSFEIIDGRDHFRLLDGGELLLWGPVSSTDPQGTVEGIYSPDPCNETN